MRPLLWSSAKAGRDRRVGAPAAGRAGGGAGTGGVADPLASSVGLRSRACLPAGRPLGHTTGKTPGSGCPNGYDPTVGRVMNGICLQEVTNIAFRRRWGKILTGERRAWETVPATRYESGSRRMGTAGVLFAQSHVGITCYPVNNVFPFAIFTFLPWKNLF